jgi:hypothetical protein
MWGRTWKLKLQGLQPALEQLGYKNFILICTFASYDTLLAVPDIFQPPQNASLFAPKDLSSSRHSTKVGALQAMRKIRNVTQVAVQHSFPS